MKVEFLSDAQMAGQLRAQNQRLETELHNIIMRNQRLTELLVALCVVNGPLEMPAKKEPYLTKGWLMHMKTEGEKVILSGTNRFRIGLQGFATLC